MWVTYVGPEKTDPVEVDGFGEVVPGQPTDIPDRLAGRAPSGHRADVDEQGNSTYDPGEGLLAQPSNWQPARAPRASRAAEAPKPEEA